MNIKDFNTIEQYLCKKKKLTDLDEVIRKKVRELITKAEIIESFKRAVIAPKEQPDLVKELEKRTREYSTKLKVLKNLLNFWADKEKYHNQESALKGGQKNGTQRNSSRH
jgi:folylpolyglutamate synthase/dihydropteroate synthase